MLNISLNESEVKRIKLAAYLKDVGHLESWKELYVFQRMTTNLHLIRDIAYLARQQSEGSIVRLPFDDTVARRYMIRAILKRLNRIIVLKNK